METINPLLALKELGYDTRKPCRGHVLVEVLPNKFKTYAFRHRSGDGHVQCRLGRLVNCYKQPISGLLIFVLDA